MEDRGQHTGKGKRRWLPRAAALAGVILWQAFIFSNSLQDGETSSSASSFVTDVLNRVLPMDVSGFFVRKMGHFTEFAVLGLLVFLFVWLLRPRAGSLPAVSGWGLLPGCLTALCDEALQLTSTGRASSVLDCMLDFAGFATGYACMALILHIGSRRRQRRAQQTATTPASPTQTAPPA